MPKISFADFQKLDIRIAKIIKAEEIEEADKLIKLTLEVGDLGERVVVAGIKEWYDPKDLKGRLVPYLANLEPREIRGVTSEGMLLAVSEEGRAVLLHPEKPVSAGEKIS